MVASRQPGRFRIGNLAELANDTTLYDALLVGNETNLETLVLRLLQYFMSVQSIENFSGVLARYNARQMVNNRRPMPSSQNFRLEHTNFCIQEDRGPSRMEILESGDVVDFGVDDDPLV